MLHYHCHMLLQHKTLHQLIKVLLVYLYSLLIHYTYHHHLDIYIEDFSCIHAAAWKSGVEEGTEVFTQIQSMNVWG